MEKVLPMDGEYLVLVGVNEAGEADALLVNVHPQFGRIARLFSNKEEFDKYLEFRSAPLGHYRKMTVEDTSAGTKGQ